MPALWPRLVLATGNSGKLREFRELLHGFAAEIVAQADLGVEPAEETACSFAGNALLKARHAARRTGSAALADDSGLEVDALGGAPGVKSARYAGPGADADANTAKLLAALAPLHGPRRARYRCVLALVRDADDDEPLLAEGSWEGSIAAAPRGSGGFGYDPVFIADGGEVTAAELAPELKNRMSHRARALAALVARLGAGAHAGG
jgi:XTP/dITP diphosphohydrolase